MSAQVASAAEQQAVATQQIDRNIVSIASMASQASDNTRRAAAGAVSMSELGKGLRELVRRFKID